MIAIQNKDAHVIGVDIAESAIQIAIESALKKAKQPEYLEHVTLYH